jgi:hypothetical protein
MKNLEIRLNALKELCDKLGIENVDYHRVYCVTIYTERISLQGQFSSTITQTIASNFKDATTSIGSTGYVEIELELSGEKFEIVLT